MFRASEHAAGALHERLFEFPLLAPYFHFAFGFAWAAGLAVTGSVGPKATPSVFRLFIAGLLSVVLFLPPIWITRGLSESADLSLTVGVPLSLAASFLPLLLLKRPSSGNDGGSDGSGTGADPLLFLISFGMQAFMLTFPLRAAKPSPPGLIALVVGTGALHLIGQYICCFVAGGTGIKKLKV